MAAHRGDNPDPCIGMSDDQRFIKDGDDKIIPHVGDLADPACAQPFPGEDRLFLKPEKFFRRVNLAWQQAGFVGR